MAVARRALTRRSKGQKSRSHGYENFRGRMVVSAVCYCCGRGTARRMTVQVSSFGDVLLKANIENTKPITTKSRNTKMA